MGWRSTLFPGYRKKPSPAVDGGPKAQESQGDVHHEKPLGKSQERQDTLKPSPAGDGGYDAQENQGDVHHEKPLGESQERQDTLHTLKLPSDPDQAPLDIVAIHGLNGDWQKSWTNPRDESFLWLRDLLPTKFPGARIMSFEYDARAIGAISPAGVREHADNLIKLLRNEREDLDDKDRPIVFIVHSLGGIIVKQALKKSRDLGMNKGPSQAEARDISTSTKGIVFFGTPHRGADAAKWGAVVDGIVSALLHRPKGELVKTLKTNSEGLLSISEDFSPLASRYAIASFYESNVHPLLGTVVVDKASALMALPHEETMMLGGDHSSMCKLGRDDRRWDPVWRAIRRCSRGVSG
ncbi:hypothetical protein B0I37DRAFT_383999 [Chaetomium sp. MPI-CAGE-AT-0009]|nr:hypothetical protein B0I37DRAFT_383999 [Chaetomium sp. MPI-CAGE-AT-0009]